eukprot:CAMPEP_0201594976 /NCGR_PEP_ID=MMETSP0190_2-20130828/192126_1 /ASSEMBLY_ACC=CAM_ASM_000263 /TAXON_ID=37353 /ORGANISM="Rosalina sp." /LENGTH=357 /DNA_ID=CAMNT_0048054795 /DNA_START=1743 /DNA_END=2813 /DNA_ORIENTATION=+
MKSESGSYIKCEATISNNSTASNLQRQILNGAYGNRLTPETIYDEHGSDDKTYQGGTTISRDSTASDLQGQLVNGAYGNIFLHGDPVDMEHKYEDKSETGDSGLSYPSLNNGSVQSSMFDDSGSRDCYGRNNNHLTILITAPSIPKQRSFNSWNSGCNGERQSDQSSSSSSVAGNYNYDDIDEKDIGVYNGTLSMPGPEEMQPQRSRSIGSFNSWDSGCNGVTMSQQSSTPSLSEAGNDICDEIKDDVSAVVENKEEKEIVVKADEDVDKEEQNLVDLDESIYEDDNAAGDPNPPPLAMPNPFGNDFNSSIPQLIFGQIDNFSPNAPSPQLAKNATMVADRGFLCSLNNQRARQAVW